MKQIIFPFTVIITILFCSCADQEKEKTLEELAIDFQMAYRTFNFNTIKPYISSGSISFAKNMYELHPLSKEKREELIKTFKDKENKVISKRIDKQMAEVEMCCNAYGDSFPTFWVLEGDNWKVDFERTMKYSGSRYGKK